MTAPSAPHASPPVHHDANHRAKPKPWNQHANTNLTLAELHSGELTTVRNILVFFVLIFTLAWIAKWWDTREKKKMKKKRSVLNDDEAANPSVEMSELNAAAEEAGAEEGGGLAVREGMDGVRDELARLRLSKYAPAFEEGGYDVWPEILRLPPIRLSRLLEMVEMSPNHADRFKEALHAQRKKHNIVMNLAKPKEEECVIL